jgi:hypothetical protein
MPYKNIEDKRRAQREYMRSHPEVYERNRAKAKARRYKWYAKYKESLICTNCEMAFIGKPECCDFHHTDPELKLETVSIMVCSRYNMAKVRAEIAKCIPLCANCHRTEHKV